MQAPRVRRPRRQVDGVLLLDKPAGLTSNAALQRAKRMFDAEKAGHTGTLDPLATGLLPVCFGEATKFAQGLLDARKAYLASVHFGVATTTGDAEGVVIAQGAAVFTAADIAGVLPRFLGSIRQIPPRHAALKHEGRPYYAYARAGIEIARPAREVRIESIDIVECVPPTAILRVVCGKGTYIRALAEDLGAALGTFAYLEALRRTAAGPFDLDDATTLEGLEAMDLPCRDALLLAPDAPLADMTVLYIDWATARNLGHGRSSPSDATAGRYRCLDPAGRFFGVVEVGVEGIRAVRLVAGRGSD